MRDPPNTQANNANFCGGRRAVQFWNEPGDSVSTSEPERALFVAIGEINQSFDQSIGGGVAPNVACSGIKPVHAALAGDIDPAPQVLRDGLDGTARPLPIGSVMEED